MIESIGLGGLASTVMKSAMGSFIRSWWKRRALRNFKEVARESLGRELRYALEITSLIESNSANEDVMALLASTIEIRNFEAICGSGVPISRLFPDPITQDANQCFDGNDNHRAWAKGLTSQYLLIERTYFRLKIIKAKIPNELGGGDLCYLKKLLLASIRTLQN